MSGVVTVQVHMLSFAGRGRLRFVEVPVERWDTARSDEERLELVFEYGQNEVQPDRDLPSLSPGDVVRLGPSSYRVAHVGFEKLGGGGVA